jgi:uncharacterized protein (TIGR02594 family)
MSICCDYASGSGQSVAEVRQYFSVVTVTATCLGLCCVMFHMQHTSAAQIIHHLFCEFSKVCAHLLYLFFMQQEDSISSKINNHMRAIILIVALGACSVPVDEFKQTLSEGASGVVYAVTESPAPEVNRSRRPVARPVQAIPVSVVRPVVYHNPLNTAEQYLGYTEVSDRSALREFLGVDPRQTEWCAAFVNSALHHSGFEGSESVSNYPLLARGFVEWGEPVDHKREEPKAGDVVIFPRGRQSWQGHVGFYVDTVHVDGKAYWQILGGNQNNSVSIELYDPGRAIAVRRAPAPEPVTVAHNIFDIIRNWFV